LLEDILLSPALGPSDGDPVGGLVARSPEAVPLSLARGRTSDESQDRFFF
jgi:hypothetical protein